MSRLSTLYYQLRVYKNFYSDIAESKRLLTNTINATNDSDKIGNYFRIDDNSADNGQIKKYINELIDYKNQLEVSIIPSINSKIREINREIREEEEKELSSEI